MLIYPAIDLLDGKAVRLEQGKRESAKVYTKKPWEQAKAWAGEFAPRLHVVDLDAAFSSGAKNNHKTLAKIFAATTLDVEVGGGIRSIDDCRKLFSLGARFVVLGTAAIKDPEMVEKACAEFPRRVIVAVDAREGKVAVEGWTEDTAMTALEIGAAVARARAGAVLYTDIGRDGMRSGPNLAATAELCRHISPCPVIASGGVSTLEDIDDLRKTGAFAAVVGKALYEGAFTLDQAVKRAFVRSL